MKRVFTDIIHEEKNPKLVLIKLMAGTLLLALMLVITAGVVVYVRVHGKSFS